MTVEPRLDALLALQSMDMRIAELIDRSEEIPRPRAEEAREIKTLESEQRERGQALERTRLDRRARESELETEQERRGRYERQLEQVKTNVAYSALLSEIQGTKRRIGELEDAILSLMAEHEEHEGRIAEIKVELAAKRSEAAGELDALATEEADLAQRLTRDKVVREALVAAADARIYRLYDRLRRGRRFPALVPLRGQACGVCHGHLPPQIVREITHHGTLHACEGCGVLIYAE
jgi:predicted  nucleic acid-binding Zn-ribbon protein